MNFGKVLEGLGTAAASRHWITSATTAGTVLMALGMMDAEQAKGLVDSMQQVMNGLGEVVGGLKGLAAVAGPVVVLIMGKIAGASSTIRGRLKSLGDDPMVEKVVVKDPSLSDSVPSEKVVSTKDVKITNK